MTTTETIMQQKVADLNSKYAAREKRLYEMPLNMLRNIASEGGYFMASTAHRGDLVRYILSKEYRHR